MTGGVVAEILHSVAGVPSRPPPSDLVARSRCVQTPPEFVIRQRDAGREAQRFERVRGGHDLGLLVRQRAEVKTYGANARGRSRAPRRRLA